MKSWKTSLAGLALILNAAATVLTAFTDGNPATNPDWNVFMSQAIAGIGLMLSRDFNKSSEDHNIVTKTTNQYEQTTKT